jgi:hypothetical protein
MRSSYLRSLTTAAAAAAAAAGGRKNPKKERKKSTEMYSGLLSQKTQNVKSR